MLVSCLDFRICKILMIESECFSLSTKHQMLARLKMSRKQNIIRNVRWAWTKEVKPTNTLFLRYQDSPRLPVLRGTLSAKAKPTCIKLVAYNGRLAVASKGGSCASGKGQIHRLREAMCIAPLTTLSLALPSYSVCQEKLFTDSFGHLS